MQLNLMYIHNLSVTAIIYADMVSQIECDTASVGHGQVAVIAKPLNGYCVCGVTLLSSGTPPQYSGSRLIGLSKAAAERGTNK